MCVVVKYPECELDFKQIVWSPTFVRPRISYSVYPLSEGKSVPGSCDVNVNFPSGLPLTSATVVPLFTSYQKGPGSSVKVSPHRRERPRTHLDSHLDAHIIIDPPLFRVFYPFKRLVMPYSSPPS